MPTSPNFPKKTTAKATTPPPKVANDHPITSYPLETLQYNTTYYWQITAEDQYGATAEGPIWTFTTENEPNQPPTAPTITGKTKPRVNTPHEYTFVSTDVNVDNVAYMIDWGDGTTMTWSSYITQGTEYKATHTWTEQGTKTIRAKAKDIHDEESPWETLQISVPLTQQSQTNPVQRILELRWLLLR